MQVIINVQKHYTILNQIFGSSSLLTYFHIKLFKMDYNKYIERNPEIMLGKPIIKGTRITVEIIMRKLAGGFSIDKLIEAYPHLNSSQIFAALEYAADLIANEEELVMI
jgi:uncharacterized protein (DUF433 family)